MSLVGLARLMLPIKGDPVRNRASEKLEVDTWELSRFVATRLVPVVGVIPFPLNEQMLMVAAVCAIRPTHIFEWGTNIGMSARIFHETCRTFKIAAEIHSVDLPDDVSHEEHPGKKRGKLVRNIRKVQLHLGDGLDVSLGLLARTSGTCRPLFFLDGDHSYETVRRELETITTRAPQAHILLHDTFWQSEGSGYNTGPHRAINETLEKLPKRFERIEQHLGLPGMTLLWNRETAAR
jgi:cephalosporin hydroxylase